MNFRRTPQVDALLQQTLSQERLSRYLAARDGDLDAAIALYEQNSRISEAFYIPLQGLEICLRNSLHGQMNARYGDDWIRTSSAPLDNNTGLWIDEAIREFKVPRDTVPTGSIVAELKFAFWVSLLGKRYDATLWRQALFRAFLPGGGTKRSMVHNRMNALRRLRNRIAHHEPIFERDLQATHNEIIEAIRWMCPHTSQWINAQSRVCDVLDATGTQRNSPDRDGPLA